MPRIEIGPNESFEAETWEELAAKLAEGKRHASVLIRDLKSQLEVAMQILDRMPVTALKRAKEELLNDLSKLSRTNQG